MDLNQIKEELLSIGHGTLVVPRIGLLGDEKDKVIGYLPTHPSARPGLLLSLSTTDGFYHTERSRALVLSRPVLPQDYLLLKVAIAFFKNYLKGRVIIREDGRL